jgi:hypothetical protein
MAILGYGRSILKGVEVSNTIGNTRGCFNSL